MVTQVSVLVAAVVVAGLASAAETAALAISYERLKVLRAGRGRGRGGGRGGGRGAPARALHALRGRPIRLLTVLWALRIAATAAAAIAVWEIARQSFGAAHPWSGVVAAAVAIAALAWVQALARAIAVERAEPLALTLAVPVWLLSFPLIPLWWPAEALVGLVSPNAAKALPRITDRELRDLVGSGNGEPEIDEHERRLIQRAFELDQTTAYDTMTPRVDIFAWPETCSLAEIAPRLSSVRFSRVPLYRESIDRITGVLYVRDAYQALISGQHDVELRALAREPLLVPGSVTLDKLLPDFQTRRIHMGIVIDEYGGTDGLITLEDILEELVGEIVDETDVAEDPIIRLSRNDILVDGGADLREINHFFNTAFPLLEHRSLNGYLLGVLGRVPEAGEKFTQEGVSIEIIEASDTQVLRAKLTRIPQADELVTAVDSDAEQS